MSVRMRIQGMVCAAALVALCAGLSFGQGKNTPCGGQYAGNGLKATFWGFYDDWILPGEPGYIIPGEPGYPAIKTWLSNITNGNASSYQYSVPDGDCVFLYRNGHVIAGVGWPLEWSYINHDRWVNMRFAYKDTGMCNPIVREDPFTDANVLYNTAAIQFWTGGGFIPTRGSDNRLLLTGTNANLNFDSMTPGTTYYCGMMVKFFIKGFEEGYRLDTEVKVYYGLLDTGEFGWAITPIHEPYDVRPVTKIGKRLVLGNPVSHDSSVYHQEIHSLTSPECYGEFYLPFKLVLERL